MVAWHPAPAIDRLLEQVNALWPNRSKKSDGIIGDTAHSKRVSDHNPDPKTGEVRAIDLTVEGIDVDALLDAVIPDIRTRYVIYNRRIIYGEAVTGVPSGWHPYTGANPHDKHVHISIRSVGTLSRSRAEWSFRKGQDVAGSKSRITLGHLRSVERRIILLLRDLGRRLSDIDTRLKNLESGGDK